MAKIILIGPVVVTDLLGIEEGKHLGDLVRVDSSSEVKWREGDFLPVPYFRGLFMGIVVVSPVAVLVYLLSLCRPSPTGFNGSFLLQLLLVFLVAFGHKLKDSLTSDLSGVGDVEKSYIYVGMEQLCSNRTLNVQ